MKKANESVNTLWGLVRILRFDGRECKLSGSPWDREPGRFANSVTSVALIVFSILEFKSTALWSESRMLRKIRKGESVEKAKTQIDRRRVPVGRALAPSYGPLSSTSHVLSALDHRFPVSYHMLAKGRSTTFSRLYPALYVIATTCLDVLDGLEFESMVDGRGAFGFFPASDVLNAFRIKVYLGSFTVIGALSPVLRTKVLIICAILGFGNAFFLVLCGHVFPELNCQARRVINLIRIVVAVLITANFAVVDGIALLGSNSTNVHSIASVLLEANPTEQEAWLGDNSEPHPMGSSNAEHRVQYIASEEQRARMRNLLCAVAKARSGQLDISPSLVGRLMVTSKRGHGIFVEAMLFVATSFLFVSQGLIWGREQNLPVFLLVDSLELVSVFLLFVNTFVVEPELFRTLLPYDESLRAIPAGPSQPLHGR